MLQHVFYSHRFIHLTAISQHISCPPHNVLPHPNFSHLPPFFPLSHGYISLTSRVVWIEDLLLPFLLEEIFTFDFFFTSSWHYTFSGTLPQRRTTLLIAVINFCFYYIRRNSIAQENAFFTVFLNVIHFFPPTFLWKASGKKLQAANPCFTLIACKIQSK